MLIYLTGYMGSGKSRYGKVAARLLGFEFRDLDDIIEERAGMEISAIFSASGEAHFRVVEREALISTVPDAPCIIATGGGTPCDKYNLMFMKQHGITIYLQLDPRSLAARLKHLASSRPLLQPHLDDLDSFVATHLSTREPWYLQSDIIIKGEGLTGKRLAEEIRKAIETR
jgi:shikimate kinase